MMRKRSPKQTSGQPLRRSPRLNPPALALNASVASSTVGVAAGSTQKRPFAPPTSSSHSSDSPGPKKTCIIAPSIVLPGNDTPLVERRCYSRSIRKNPRQPWEVLCGRQSGEFEQFGGKHKYYSVPLARGGSLHVWPNVVPVGTLADLHREMKEKARYRQYEVQSENEPRVHALYHEEASLAPPQQQLRSGDDDADPLANQKHSTPGYRYASVTMKARPLSELPEIYNFSKSMKTITTLGQVPQDSGTSWGIGVNLICYRSGNDRIGFHADDDQKESAIVTVMVHGPPRQVLVRTKLPKKKDKDRNDGEDDETEEIRLLMSPGDAYTMDGAMQKHYVHSVPKEVRQAGPGTQRLVIVLRDGETRTFRKDSGLPVASLDPPPPTTCVFGPVANLTHGQRHTRRQLVKMGAHGGRMRSISGNKEVGSDAIIRSGLKHPGHEDVSRHSQYILYAAPHRVGAGAILTSALKQESIRVFEKLEGKENKYCGLYNIVGCHRIPWRTKWRGQWRNDTLHMFVLRKRSFPQKETVDPSPEPYHQEIQTANKTEKMEIEEEFLKMLDQAFMEMLEQAFFEYVKLDNKRYSLRHDILTSKNTDGADSTT